MGTASGNLKLGQLEKLKGITLRGESDLSVFMRLKTIRHSFYFMGTFDFLYMDQWLSPRSLHFPRQCTRTEEQLLNIFPDHIWPGHWATAWRISLCDEALDTLLPSVPGPSERKVDCAQIHFHCAPSAQRWNQLRANRLSHSLLSSKARAPHFVPAPTSPVGGSQTSHLVPPASGFTRNFCMS